MALFDVYCKGSRIPNKNPNCSCEVWHEISGLFEATTAKEAQLKFYQLYAGEFMDCEPIAVNVPPTSPLYKAWAANMEVVK